MTTEDFPIPTHGTQGPPGVKGPDGIPSPPELMARQEARNATLMATARHQPRERVTVPAWAVAVGCAVSAGLGGSMAYLIHLLLA